MHSSFKAAYDINIPFASFDHINYERWDCENFLMHVLIKIMEIAACDFFLHIHQAVECFNAPHREMFEVGFS
jgi:hypothetical protein